MRKCSLLVAFCCIFLLTGFKSIESSDYNTYVESCGAKKFAVYDLDGDGVMELFTKIGDYISLFSYTDNERHLLLSTNKGIKIYNNGVFYIYYLSDDSVNESWYTFKSGRCLLKAEKHGSTEKNLITGGIKSEERQNSYLPYVYEKDGKEVSYIQYKKYKNKTLKSKRVKLKWYNNTLENRQEVFGY